MNNLVELGWCFEK